MRTVLWKLKAGRWPSQTWIGTQEGKLGSKSHQAEKGLSRVMSPSQHLVSHCVEDAHWAVQNRRQAVQSQSGPHWTRGCLPSRLSWVSRASWDFPLEGKMRRGQLDRNPSSIFVHDKDRRVDFFWNTCVPLTVITFSQMQVQTGVGLRGRGYDPTIEF